tara:strand:- start:157 stop:354 length:198 start_codon:yes stop_codon:yes gene_type:complete
MPIKSASIDFSKVKEEKLSESELRKQAIRQLMKDSRSIARTTGKILFGFVFLYGLVSLLQDVNVI